MRKIIITIGFVLILLNSIIGFVISGYNPFNIIMVDVSLFFTTSVIYFSLQSNMPDGFKIGYTVIFSFTGLMRLICSVIAQSDFTNNFAFVGFAILLCLEIVCVVIGLSLKDK